MARSFSSQPIRRKPPMSQLFLPLAVFALVMSLFFWGLGNIDSTTREEKLNSARRAVTKAMVQCYALEGQYPASITYLKDNYGLRVDEEKYIVHLDFFAGNIMPQITVMDRYW